ILPSLARFDFESYFHRALLIAALILLWPLLRALRTASWRGLALEKNPRAGADLAIGFAIAAIPLFCCGTGFSGKKCRPCLSRPASCLFWRNCFFVGLSSACCCAVFRDWARSFSPR